MKKLKFTAVLVLILSIQLTVNAQTNADSKTTNTNNEHHDWGYIGLLGLLGLFGLRRRIGKVNKHVDFYSQAPKREP